MTITNKRLWLARCKIIKYFLDSFNCDRIFDKIMASSQSIDDFPVTLGIRLHKCTLATNWHYQWMKSVS